MNKEEKVDLVSSMKSEFQDKSSFVLMDYRGINNSDFTNFRNELREKGLLVKVAKNTLIKIAIKGSDLEGLNPYLTGPTVVIYGDDIVSLAKIVSKASAKNDNLNFTAGYYNNDLINDSDINKLSKLKSIEELRATFIGILNSAQSKFVGTIKAPMSQSLTLLNAYAKSKE
ncbi:50S ribosomal protein L10 [Rickettsiales bacterium]|nr:50S ribosomal protein L10 [Rickettsiales bacterium]